MTSGIREPAGGAPTTDERPVPDLDPAADRTADQATISAEIADIATREQGSARTGPLLDYPPYRSSVLRHPTRPPVVLDPEEQELLAPVFGRRDVDPLEADLTIQHRGEPLGERIVVTGRVLDGWGRPVRPPARRGVAGQLQRPLHPPARPAPRAAGPELHRRWAAA